jgi:hypothetical protein
VLCLLTNELYFYLSFVITFDLPLILSNLYRACSFFTNLDLLYIKRVRYLPENIPMYTAHVYFLRILTFLYR